MKINGYELIGMHAVESVDGGIDGYVIAGQTSDGHCAVGVVKTLDDAEWWNGSYFTRGTPSENRVQALQRMHIRAHVLNERRTDATGVKS